MSENKRALFKQWLGSGKTNLQPLTFSQRELWETSPVPPGDTANHICCLIYLRGLITAEACENALRRHRLEAGDTARSQRWHTGRKR